MVRRLQSCVVAFKRIIGARNAAPIKKPKECHMALAHAIAEHLPYLRRYARALCGSQKSGDAYVRASLETMATARCMSSTATGQINSD